jgi:acyl-coenzyme A synthetase/AMP-(fatty) acid ligase
MTVSLQFPVFLRSVVVIGPVTPGPTEPHVAKDVLRYSKAQGALLPPALIDGLCDDAEGLQCLRNLDYLYFAGAPLTQRSAEKLVGDVAVKPAMGSTEAGAYFIRTIDQDDWQYYSFRIGMGIELQHVADNMYEAVFVRNPKVERWQQVFQVYPELNEFHTKDLFARHPTKADLWVSPALRYSLSSWSETVR